MAPDIRIRARIFRIDEPEITQIPVKKSAAIARIAFFNLSADENEDLTAKINRTATRII
jgi:hypothetical protein